MKNTVYLLSLCEKVIAKEAKYLVHFHFKGVYLGHKIENIILESEKELYRSCEYFLLFEVFKTHDKTIYGKILKFRVID